MAPPDATQTEYGVQLAEMDEMRDLNALILAVPHRHYDEFDAAALSAMLQSDGVLVDVKSVLAPNSLRQDIRYWSL